MLCRHRYVIKKSTETQLPDTPENIMLSEEEVEENLALNLNLHLLEFGGILANKKSLSIHRNFVTKNFTQSYFNSVFFFFSW